MITPQQILDNRAARKAAGLAGCMTGKPVPEIDFFGFNDVQIWNMDATGRMPGHEGFDHKNPYCFCFDHRDAFDPKGTVDAELVNAGHKAARYTYRSLFPNDPVPDMNTTTSDSSVPVGAPASQILDNSTNPPGFSNDSSPPGSE